MTDIFYRPDWVVIGGPVQGAQAPFCVIASNTLSEARIKAIVTEHWLPDEREKVLGMPYDRTVDYYLNGHMHTITMVYGYSYGECMEKLAEHWKPEASEQSGLSQPKAELSS